MLTFKLPLFVFIAIVQCMASTEKNIHLLFITVSVATYYYATIYFKIKIVKLDLIRF